MKTYQFPKHLTIGKYKLDENKNPVPVYDFFEWAEQFGTTNNRIAIDIINGIRISTIFLSIDHCWNQGGKPILFETMIFDDNNGCEPFDYQVQYCTYEEALAGHNEAVQWVKNGCKEEETT